MLCPEILMLVPYLVRTHTFVDYADALAMEAQHELDQQEEEDELAWRPPEE